MKTRGISSGSQEEESEAKKGLETYLHSYLASPKETVKDFTVKAQCDFYFT